MTNFGTRFQSEEYSQSKIRNAIASMISSNPLVRVRITYVIRNSAFRVTEGVDTVTIKNLLNHPVLYAPDAKIQIVRIATYRYNYVSGDRVLEIATKEIGRVTLASKGASEYYRIAFDDGDKILHRSEICRI